MLPKPLCPLADRASVLLERAVCEALRERPLSVVKDSYRCYGCRAIGERLAAGQVLHYASSGAGTSAEGERAWPVKCSRALRTSDEPEIARSHHWAGHRLQG